MQASLPKWVKTDRYEDHSARSPGQAPTKRPGPPDDAVAVGGAVRPEGPPRRDAGSSRVFALTLAKRGKLGPKLISLTPKVPVSRELGISLHWSFERLDQTIWVATFFGGQFSSPGGRSGSSGSRQRSGARCGAWNWLFLTGKFCTYRLRVFRKTSRRKVDGR